MTPDALIIFLKYPERGRVKTRIASSHGDDFALDLYNAFIRDILDMSVSVRADKILVIDRTGGLTGASDFGTGYRIIEQVGRDLGERMHNAFCRAFDSGYRRAVLIGSDLPDLDAALVDKALGSLHEASAVVGRSMDGGYYLIGFSDETLSPDYFTGIDWSTPEVFRQTMDLLIRDYDSIVLLENRMDIDEYSDLKNFYHKKRSSGETSSHTYKYILECILNKNIKL